MLCVIVFQADLLHHHFSLIMETFTAHRISQDDNVLFPDIMEIDVDRVLLTKNRIFGHRTTTIYIKNIASVTMSSGILFADVKIETTGGRVYRSEGYRKSDARRIVELLTV